MARCAALSRAGRTETRAIGLEKRSENRGKQGNPTQFPRKPKRKVLEMCLQAVSTPNRGGRRGESEIKRKRASLLFLLVFDCFQNYPGVLIVSGGELPFGHFVHEK